jgi:putative ABC transport system permease protein
VDERFLGFYNIRLLEGRNFQSDQPADKHAVLISKSAAALLGFKTPNEAVGATLYLEARDDKPAHVIGVFEDYEFLPLLSHLTFSLGRFSGSLLTYKNYLLPNANSSRVSLKVDNTQLHSTLSKIEQTFRRVFPEEGFRWQILNDNINRHYNDERIGRNQVVLFTLIAIFIASLGLLGMVANKAVEKTKEIGIRKVLGARALHIAEILVRSTVLQLLIGVAIGIPLSLYFTTNYLERFSERITLQWWHYAIPVMILMAILFATVVSVLIKAVRTNPVDSLKCE